MSTSEKIKRMYEVHRVEEEEGISLDEYSEGFYNFYIDECKNGFSGTFDDFVDAGYNMML